MKIEFIEKDQNWQNEQTIYWFDFDGENYGISDINGYLQLLDYEGYPIEDCNDFNGVKEKLIKLIEDYKYD